MEHVKTGQKRIYISGAGIAGMSAALALAAKGFCVTVFEKAPRLHDVGAGFQLAPNTISTLREWGVLDTLYNNAAEPAGIDLKDGINGRTLMHMDIKAISRKRWQEPYLTIHRADLQGALQTAIAKNPLISLETGHEVVSCSGTAMSGFDIEVTQGKNIKKSAAPLLLCCDGVWSRLRARIGEQALFSGYIAWRATLAAEKIPPRFLHSGADTTVSVWMGKKGHFITYPLRGGRIYNFVAITRGQNPGASWSQKGKAEELLHCFAGWHPAVGDVIRQAPQWTFWPLFKMPFSRFLGPSGEIFLGDAAHAITPFAAQGAAMAIEDAAALAAALAAERLSQAQALARFDEERRKRLKAVARRSDFNRFVYHAAGPLALARNLVMKARPAEKFLADLDWLYGYDATHFIHGR